MHLLEGVYARIPDDEWFFRRGALVRHHAPDDARHPDRSCGRLCRRNGHRDMDAGLPDGLSGLAEGHGRSEAITVPQRQGRADPALRYARRNLVIYVAEKYDIDIPITPQLLEANGITLVEVGDNGPSTPAKYRSRFEKWRISTKWKDINLWYDRTAKYWHIQGMEAAHLHTSKQLQQALYMADIPLELNCRI